ncbi:MAG: phage tail protein [Magnetococcales bacterium]|nr:phage tail protein [Magnetococcales bacterium]
MADPFVGEIRMFGGSYAPVDWAECNGQLIPTSQHEQLFSLIGSTYGGNGVTTFGLPDMRGRAPAHLGTGPGLPRLFLGQMGGVETSTLTTNTMPAHSHALKVSTSSGGGVDPLNKVWGTSTDLDYDVYAENGTMVALDDTTLLDSSGSQQPFYNMMPYTVITFIIALEGIYPPRH